MASAEEILEEVRSFREENSKAHGVLFGRVGKLELAKAFADGQASVKPSNSNGKDSKTSSTQLKALPQRKGETIWGIPTMTLLVVLISGIAGDRILHWIALLFGIQ